MILHVPKKGSAWPIHPGLVTTNGLPPKDPQEDDDEDERDNEEGDSEEEKEPAVIREPDEC